MAKVIALVLLTENYDLQNQKLFQYQLLIKIRSRNVAEMIVFLICCFRC